MEGGSLQNMFSRMLKDSMPPPPPVQNSPMLRSEDAPEGLASSKVPTKGKEKVEVTPDLSHDSMVTGQGLEGPSRSTSGNKVLHTNSEGVPDKAMEVLIAFEVGCLNPFEALTGQYLE